MAPGIRGEAPFTGLPTPIICPGCGDRLFSIRPGLLKCELCEAEINVPEDKNSDTDLQDDWGGQEIVTTSAAPARANRAFNRQNRKTGAIRV